MIDINRFLLSFCARYFNSKNLMSVKFVCGHVLFCQQTRAGFIGVVKKIPKLLLHLINIINSCRIPRLVRTFLHAKENASALCIGEGGIGFPETGWKLLSRRLYLKPIIFSVRIDVTDIESFCHCVISHP